MSISDKIEKEYGFRIDETKNREYEIINEVDIIRGVINGVDYDEFYNQYWFGTRPDIRWEPIPPCQDMPHYSDLCRSGGTVNCVNCHWAYFDKNEKKVWRVRPNEGSRGR